MTLIIGISYAPQERQKARNYHSAVRHAAAGIEIDVETIDLNAFPERAGEVDALLFTGGADIDPSRYGKDSERNLCEEIQPDRDAAEFKLAQLATDRGLPVLGICRGAQLLNVFHGGSLTTDIAHYGGHQHRSGVSDVDMRHPVRLTPGSFVSKIIGETEGEINSAHHQAVDRVGDGLVISAKADDGTPEAIEWADPTGKPFFLAVQWHPERMTFDEKFAGRIFEAFLWEAEMHSKLKGRLGSLVPKLAEAV